MTTSLLEPLLHTVTALGLLAAYCVLWDLGHQDSVLLGLLAGQLGGVAVSSVAQKVQAARATRTPAADPGPAPPTGA